MNEPIKGYLMGGQQPFSVDLQKVVVQFTGV